MVTLGSESRTRHTCGYDPAVAMSDARAGQPSAVRSTTIVRIGIAAAGATYVLLALTWSLVTPAMWGTDESSNAAYGALLARGQWPTIDTPKDTADLPGLEERAAFDAAIGASWREDIWTAHQPPLYYALAGAVSRVTSAAWGSEAGLVGARTLTVLCGLGGVVATGMFALSAFPARPQAAVLASGLVALTPTIPHYAGQIYADVLVFTLCTVAFVITASIVTNGPTDRSTLALLAVWTLLALTKASGAAVVGAGIVAVTVWWLIVARRQRSTIAWRPSPRWWLATGLLLALAAVPYGVNLVRYGEPIGSQAVITKIGRVAGDQGWLATVGDPSFWLYPVDLLLLETSEVVPEVVPRVLWGWRLVLVEPLLVGFVLVWAKLRRPAIDEDVSDKRRWASLLAPTVGCVALLVLSVAWIVDGGTVHARYYFPVAAFLGLSLAWACDALGRWGVIAGAVLVAAMSGATAHLLRMFQVSVMVLERSGPQDPPRLVADPWHIALVTLGLAGAAVLGMFACYVLPRRANTTSQKRHAGRPTPAQSDTQAIDRDSTQQRNGATTTD